MQPEARAPNGTTWNEDPTIAVHSVAMRKPVNQHSYGKRTAENGDLL